MKSFPLKLRFRRVAFSYGAFIRICAAIDRITAMDPLTAPGFLPRYDIPYVPSLDERVRVMVELAGPLQGKKTVDLGSGDGRVVIAFAKNGAQAVGVEVDPVRAATASECARQAGLDGNVFVHNTSFWDIDLSSFDIITLYGITSIMERLEKKIEQEAKRGCLIISNTFTFPHWTPLVERDGIYLYKKI